jgi:hypothetical protein
VNKSIAIENAVKAAQCADLLLQDLQSLLFSSDAVLALLVFPEIEKVAGVKQRMEAIVSALEAEQREAIIQT